MVNFNDPSSVESDLWTLMKFWHCVDSIYLWEFVTTLDYEWSVIRGARPYRWTIWIYSFTRMATLVAVVLSILVMQVSSPINCQAWISFELIFSYLAFMAASLLIVLRVIAIWNRNKFIVAIATSVWVTNVGFLIEGATRLRAKWMPGSNICLTLNTQGNEPNVISTLVTDIVLLLMMLLGSHRLHCCGGGTFRLGRLLWKQGVIWLLVAAIAEIPPVVFICLNISVVFNLMFQTPSMIVMSIAATRMYRSLSDIASRTEVPDTAQDKLQKGFRVFSKTSRPPIAPIQSNRTEVAVRMDFARYPMVETSYDGSCIDIEAPLGEKPHRMVPCDIEGGVGN